jgi:hypothetical protein
MHQQDVYLLEVLKYLNLQQILKVMVMVRKKDQTYLSEYVDRKQDLKEVQSPTAQDVTGFPKYYAMFGGATILQLLQEVCM